MPIEPTHLIAHPSGNYFSYRFKDRLITFPAASQPDALAFMHELVAHLAHSDRGVQSPPPHTNALPRSTMRFGGKSEAWQPLRRKPRGVERYRKR